MARTEIAVHAVGRTGTRTITMTNGDAVNQHQFSFGVTALLLVNNGSASEITVTVKAPQTIDGMVLPGLVMAVPAGGEAIIGPFPERTYKQTNGKVYVDLSAGTSVKLAVLAP